MTRAATAKLGAYTALAGLGLPAGYDFSTLASLLNNLNISYEACSLSSWATRRQTRGQVRRHGDFWSQSPSCAVHVSRRLTLLVDIEDAPIASARSDIAPSVLSARPVAIRPAAAVARDEEPVMSGSPRPG